MATIRLGPLGLSLSHVVIHSAYSRTERTSPLIFARPPVGSARTSPHTLQLILLTALLKMSCSLPHFWHFTRRNTLLGLGISLFQSDIFYTPIVWLVFLGGCHLYGACSYRLCILSEASVFWWFLRRCVAMDIFVRRNPSFRVRGGARL